MEGKVRFIDEVRSGEVHRGAAAGVPRRSVAGDLDEEPGPQSERNDHTDVPDL
jgi:hypothetical protein